MCPPYDHAFSFIQKLLTFIQIQFHWSVNLGLMSETRFRPSPLKPSTSDQQHPRGTKRKLQLTDSEVRNAKDCHRPIFDLKIDRRSLSFKDYKHTKTTDPARTPLRQGISAEELVLIRDRLDSFKTRFGNMSSLRKDLVHDGILSEPDEVTSDTDEGSDSNSVHCQRQSTAFPELDRLEQPNAVRQKPYDKAEALLDKIIHKVLYLLEVALHLFQQLVFQEGLLY